jgi:hypothetical protein
MNRPGEKSPRLAYVDNLRALMIIFVVMIHVGVTYSGLGSWYYKENQDLGPVSLLLFGIFQSFTQAYSMGLLFLFAGYFIPGALERKGAKRFVKDRLFRLGVPVLVYIFIIHPVCIAIAYPDTNIADYSIRGIVSLDFVSWSGPLWFAFALLIFTLAYILIGKLFGVNLRGIPPGFGSPLTLKRGLLLVAVISAVAFALRTAFPIGTDVINMQLGYFSSYAVMFVMGVTGLRKSYLDGIERGFPDQRGGELAGRGLRFLGVLFLRRHDHRAHRDIQGAFQLGTSGGEVPLGPGLRRVRVSRTRSYLRHEGSERGFAPPPGEVLRCFGSRGVGELPFFLCDQEGRVPPKGFFMISAGSTGYIVRGEN